MLEINFEFRKGIFFIRLIGNLSKETPIDKINELNKLIIDNKFKYVVINTNYLNMVDLTGLSYLTEVCCVTKEIASNLIICDKSKLLKTLLNDNVPNINTEKEVL